MKTNFSTLFTMCAIVCGLSFTSNFGMQPITPSKIIEKKLALIDQTGTLMANQYANDRRLIANGCSNIIDRLNAQYVESFKRFLQELGIDEQDPASPAIISAFLNKLSNPPQLKIPHPIP